MTQSLQRRRAREGAAFESLWGVVCEWGQGFYKNDAVGGCVKFKGRCSLEAREQRSPWREGPTRPSVFKGQEKELAKELGWEPWRATSKPSWRTVFQGQGRGQDCQTQLGGRVDAFLGCSIYR